MQRRIVLTRDEVSIIVRRHLRAKGLHPLKDDEHARNHLVSLQALAVPGIETAKDTPWGDWPAIYFTWDEDAPVEAKVEPTNDEGM